MLTIPTAISHAAAAILAVNSHGVIGQPPEQPAPQQQPADEPRIPASAAGWLISKGQDQAIIATALPSQESHTVRPARPQVSSPEGSHWVHTLSAPDRNGRIAFMLGLSMGQDASWELRTIGLDGTAERTLFARKGDLIWGNSIKPIRGTPMGRQIALSDDGVHVALIKDVQDRQMTGALLEEGELELWDIERASSRTVGSAIDLGIEFFPGGQSLAVVDWVSPEQAFPQMTDGFGEMFRKWSRVPAVFMLDLKTGERRFLHVGAQPVIATDAKSVLVADLPVGRAGTTHWKLVSVSDGSIQPARSERFVALLPDGTAIWLSRPGPDDPKGETKHNSPLVGPKELLVVKVGPVNGGAGVTVLSGLDPRNRVTFGPRVEAKPTP